MTVDPAYYPALARCYRGPVMREILSNGHSPYLVAAASESGLIRALGPNAMILDGLKFVFDEFRKFYRSDYVYRTAIATKLFLGRHSPKTTTMLSELRVDECAVDMVMVNGTSYAYEIKTARDNIDRLGVQLASYLKMFDLTNVVVDERHVDRVREIAPEQVGIILLTARFTLKVYRKPKSNINNIINNTIYDSLRKYERSEVIETYYGSVPDAPPLELYDIYRDLFSRIPKQQSHALMVKLLKRRRQLDQVDFSRVPRYLVVALIESGIPTRCWNELLQRLASTRLAD